MADPTPTEDVKPWQRVVVVVNWRQGSVHGITSDQSEAQRWTRELIDRYGPLAATQTADVVDASEAWTDGYAAGREAAAQAILDWAGRHVAWDDGWTAQLAKVARGGDRG